MPIITGDDIKTYLDGIGLMPDPVPAGIDFDSIAENAEIELETKTGWIPFLGITNQTRDLDPDTDEDGVILLPFGVLSLTSLTIAGYAYTASSDFWLSPRGALQRDNCYTQLQFRSRIWGDPGSLQLIGTIGRMTESNRHYERVKRCLLKRAAYEAYAEIKAKTIAEGGTSTGIVVRWKQGPVEKQFTDPTKEGGDSSTVTIATPNIVWKEEWKNLLTEFQRWV